MKKCGICKATMRSVGFIGRVQVWICNTCDRRACLKCRHPLLTGKELACSKCGTSTGTPA